MLCINKFKFCVVSPVAIPLSTLTCRDGGLYTEGNVRVTTCIANSAKNVYSDEALMDLCLAVVLKNRDNPSIANALSTICSRQFTEIHL